MRFPGRGAWKVSVVATLAAVALLVTLLTWGRQDLLGVVLALLVVLLATVAGVSAAAAREQDDEEPVAALSTADGLYGVDADTLETLDNREALRAVRERHLRRQRSATGEGG